MSRPLPGLAAGGARSDGRIRKAGERLENVMNYYFRSEEVPVYPAQADSASSYNYNAA